MAASCGCHLRDTMTQEECHGSREVPSKHGSGRSFNGDVSLMMVYPCLVLSDGLGWLVSPLTNITYGMFTEGGNFKLFARLVGLDNSVITSATVGTCSLKVFDLTSSDPTATLYSANISMPIAALSTSGGWSVDSIGYNFSYTVDHATVFASTPSTGGHRYRLEFSIPASSGTNGTALVVAEMTCMPALGG